MKLEKTLHVALDELRMQMLGAQVLIGFQLQGVFQERFAASTEEAKLISFVGLCSIVLTLGLLLAAPCQHRLVERGLPTLRIFRVANRFANLALLPFAVALGCDFFVVVEPYASRPAAVEAAVVAALLAFFLWYGIGIGLRGFIPTQEREGKPLPTDTTIELHDRIDQMLTEVRVVLPGAQALLGFQFAVTMTKAFSELSGFDRAMHFVSLCAMALAIMLLLTPATIHRLTFAGRDAERFHSIGSALVTAALAPILVGIATDFYVAATAMFQARILAGIGAAIVATTLAILWYAVPLFLRRQPWATSG
jgi:hypothetical protein